MKKRAVRLPEDWVIPEPWITWARRQGMDEAEARLQAEMMKDWSLSSPKGVMLDWFAAWRNWVRRSMARPGKSSRPDLFEQQLMEMKNGKRG